MSKTFAQYLIDDILPKGMHITKPVDNKYLADLLREVYQTHNSDYSRVVMEIKRLGDKFSTLDGHMSFGMAEIETPNKAGRDAIIKGAQKSLDGAKSELAQLKVLGDLQDDLAKNDLIGGPTANAANMMVHSAMGGKKAQLMKLRTSPGVVKGADGNIIPEIFNRSYAEGVSPLHFWLGATEARQNLAQGQVSTSAPGELNKVISNVLNSAVVSSEDCGTTRGILLDTKDPNVIDRYLARKEAEFARNTLVTQDVVSKLGKERIELIMVRSPQTCEGVGITVCSKCMGLRPSDGKKFTIGDNAGLISSGVLSEPLTQMSLSAKHSTSLAKTLDDNLLTGEKGFRKLVEMPKTYSNRKVLCEVYGTVYQIMPAPQGGTVLTIQRDTSKIVPDRYIVFGKVNKQNKQYYDYYVPPQLHVKVKKGDSVFPGMPLTDGIDNLSDIARLRNLGAVRSAAAQSMYDVYKNTGSQMDRRHFELLARAAHRYVKIESAPAGFEFHRGETVDYNQLMKAVEGIPSKEVPLTSSAIGSFLASGYVDQTEGTELTAQVIEHLKSAGVKKVKVFDNLSVSAVSTPLTRVVNQSEDWLATLNHRYLKSAVVDAATTGKGSNIHGHNPITAYAYGVEMGHKEEGKY